MQYEENRKMDDITELSRIVAPTGTALLGYVRLFDCTVCGQAWMEDWKQEKFGGTQQVKKV